VGEIFRARPNRPRGSRSPSTRSNGSFSGVKRPGRGDDDPPPSCIEAIPPSPLCACTGVSWGDFFPNQDCWNTISATTCTHYVRAYAYVCMYVNKVMRLIQYNSVFIFKLLIEFVPFKIVPLGGYTPPETFFPLSVAAPESLFVGRLLLFRCFPPSQNSVL
jgi:hypothetical protein